MSNNCPSRPRRRFLFFWHVGQPHEYIFKRIYKYMSGVSKHFTAWERCIHCSLERERSFIEPDELLSHGYTVDQLSSFDTAGWQAKDYPVPDRRQKVADQIADHWQHRTLRAEEALLLLARLKLYKDRKGKDGVYQANQVTAWKRAFDHLKAYGYDVEADALL